MSVRTTTDSTFAADVLSAGLPVLVDFTATWCPPCRMIEPVLEQIATSEAGRLQVVSLDVDANPETARRYRVMGMPTLTLFIGGEPVVEIVGARPRGALMHALEPHLAVTA